MKYEITGVKPLCSNHGVSFQNRHKFSVNLISLLLLQDTCAVSKLIFHHHKKKVIKVVQVGTIKEEKMGYGTHSS